MRTENVIFKMTPDGTVLAILLSRYGGDPQNIPAYSTGPGFHTVSYESLSACRRNATPQEYDSTLRALLGRWPRSKVHVCFKMPPTIKSDSK